MVNNKKKYVATPVKMIFMLFIILIFIALTGTTSPVSAVTWYVSTEGHDLNNSGTSWEDAFATFQQGVNASSNGDIVMVADGTYTGTGNKGIQLQGKAITVQSLNGPENCIIDCEDSGRGFYIHEGEGPDTIISGFTIHGGNVGGNPGGAIYCYDSSTPTIKNCIIRDNIGSTGGGIGCVYSGATILNCQIIKNTSSYGGGIYSIFPFRSTDNLIVQNCVIAGNSAFATATGQGGGILFAQPFSGAYLQVVNSTIVGNSSEEGGGIFLSTCANERLTNIILSGNTPENIFIDTCTPIITYSAGTGALGAGNVEDDPLFISISDLDPENWNLRLLQDSPCIDAGNNSVFVTGIDVLDIDSKPRFVDGDGDEYREATVDMGAYECGGICECDTLMDFDTDGLDLADYIDDPKDYEVRILAEDYGRADCPNYQYTP